MTDTTADTRLVKVNTAAMAQPFHLCDPDFMDAGWRGLAATLLAIMTVCAAVALVVAGVVLLWAANPYAGALLVAGIVGAAFLLITRGAQ